jgi:glycosyltransferase involved in cell wall biosynthesis
VTPLRILLVSNDRIGRNMAGPGIRYYNFARELARDHEVTLMVPAPVDIDTDGFDVVLAQTYGARAFRGYAERFDVLVAQNLLPWTMRALAKAPVRIVYDLYDPFLVENLGLFAEQQSSKRYQEALLRANSLAQEVALKTGDAFLCASQRQRDLWLGMLGTLGRLTSEEYARDPSLRNLIDIVPFGLPVEPPKKTRPVLKGVVPGIEERDRVLIWGGGIWNWFDPGTLIQAVANLADRRDDVKLYFLGVEHPNPETEEMGRAEQAVELARKLDVYDRVVFFNFGWTPYEERANYLLEGDLGVTTHFDNIETRFAFRTRVLDYLWAGLPIVTTEGDALSELVATQNLGRVIAERDVQGWERAIEDLLNDRLEYETVQRNIEETRPQFAWPNAVDALRRLVAGEAPLARGRVRSGGMVVRYVWLSIVAAVIKRGFRTALSRAVAILRRPRVP